MSDAITPPGEIITFYSYKGGTGRTMALANVGCALAQTLPPERQGGVLLIDWDLEAPGLHHYLPPVGPTFGGLLELFSLVKPWAKQVKTREDALALWQSTSVHPFIRPTAVPRLSVLQAGDFDRTYGSRVNAFSWEELFNASPPLLPAFAEYLASRYAYTLIDSRTGTTDVSGICTTIMPSKLVVVFTPNRQSLTGIFDLVRRAPRYRLESGDWRPLAVFPLPSRIEQAREELLRQWRHGSEDAPGYQPAFETLFREVYDLPECDLSEYFTEVQIQHVPDYAYGEQIAVLVETESRLSLKRSYEEFTERLRILRGPWEEPATARDEWEIERRLTEAAPMLENREALRAWGLLRYAMQIYRANEKAHSPELPELLAQTAAALRAEGKVSEARELMEAAVEAERREDGAAVPTRLIELAELSKTLGALDEARAQAQEALERAVERGQQRIAAAALEVLASIAQLSDQPDLAASALTSAIDFHSRAGEDRAASLMLQLRLAEAHAQSERLDEANAALSSMLPLLWHLDASEIRSAELLRTASGVAYALRDFTLARKFLEEALNIQRQLLGHRHSDVTDTLEALGNVMLQQDQAEEAMRNFQEVYFRRSSVLDKSDPAVIGILRKIALVARRLRDMQTARDRYEDALANAHALPRTHGFHITLRRELAELCVETGDTSRALSLVSEALPIALEVNQEEAPLLMVLQAQIYMKQGERSSAFREYLHAIVTAHKFPMMEAHVRTLYARQLVAIRNLRDAMVQYEAARTIYAEQGRGGAVAALDREIKAIPSNTM